MIVPLTLRLLFGGAITMLLPSNLLDASDIRQIPDTQEVLLYPQSDVSVILEILEEVAPSDLMEAANFHFQSLAHDNSAAMSEVQVLQSLEPAAGETPPPTILIGVQKIAKYNREQLDDVLIMMALFRLRKKRIDLVLSFNVPTVEQGQNSEMGMDAVRSHFNTAVQSLRIVDLGLFA